MVAAGQLCTAFGLPVRGATVERWRHGDFLTRRLTTADGTFLVKELAAASDALPRERFERAMTLERLAIAAGIRTAVPVTPVLPEFGWCTRIPGHGWFRAHAWLEHRPVAETDDLAAWLGETLATLHRLLPDNDDVDLTAAGIHPAASWHDWVAEAEGTGRSWSGLARRRLGDIDDLTKRLRVLYSRPDQVVTHGDFEPNNVLITADGPVLIDWDTIGSYPPALQAARVALRFGHGHNDRIVAILDAYRNAGGRFDGFGEELFFSPLGHRLASLGILIAVLLGRQQPPRWVNLATAEQRVLDDLRGLPALVDDLVDHARFVAQR